MNKIIALVGFCCIILTACKNHNPSDNISEQSTIDSKIKIQSIELKSYSREFNTTGTVKAISGQIAEIAPLFDGRVTKSHIKLGQKVNVGTPLFEMYSADFSEIVKEYFQSLQTMKMKEINFHRQKDLVQNGVGVARELEEAETDYEVALKDHENAITNLRMLNLDPKDVSMGQTLKVVSPIAGEVVHTEMVIGQYVKSDAEPLAIVAELSKIWVVAQVKEKNISAINLDDKVEISTDADPKQIIIGYISYIGELLDEETRSVQVLIVCDNAERKLKPGMFANVHFINSPKESILIPSTALLQDEDKPYVFICDDNGEFIKRTVEAVTANRQEILIISGLEVGDRIVSEGGIYLMEN